MNNIPDTVATNVNDGVQLPPELINFSFENEKDLILHNEADPKSKTEEGATNFVLVAYKIDLKDINEVVFSSILLDDLTVPQLRKLAMMFGCKGVGSMSKFHIRYTMGLKKNLNNVYSQSEICNGNNADNNTKNLIRIINTVFHTEFFESFLLINDRKKRKDFETGNGIKNENFWVDVSNFCNDLLSTGLDNFLILKNLHDHLYESYIDTFIDKGYSPVNCNQQTAASCLQVILNLIKIRACMIAFMKESGKNAHDPFLYTAAAIKRTNFVRSISQAAAYYFYMVCEEHPAIDGCIKRYLDDSIKGDSICFNGNVAETKKESKGIKEKKEMISGLVNEVKLIGKTFKKNNYSSEYYKLVNLLTYNETIKKGHPEYETLTERLDFLRSKINVSTNKKARTLSPIRRQLYLGDTANHKNGEDDEKSVSTIESNDSDGSLLKKTGSEGFLKPVVVTDHKKFMESLNKKDYFD